MPEHQATGTHSGIVADWTDDRDAPYIPAFTTALPTTFELDRYRELADETWHQRGKECTGFALAAIANYLIRKEPDVDDASTVSRRMLYEMAQHYDQEMFVEGSTLRGALKGWSRVGVAADELWPYNRNDEHGHVHGTLTLNRVLDARRRPLTGYRRVMGEDIKVMKDALASGNPLYVGALIHFGWYRLFLAGAGHVINRRPDDAADNVHAFVIIGYDEQGFLIHNSWGPEWGDEGYAVLPYDQWQWGAQDAWVVAAGIQLTNPPEMASSLVELKPAAAQQSYRDMWPHLVVLDDHGQLASTGLYEMDEGSVSTLLYLFDEYAKAQKWPKRRLAVVCDDGAASISASIERLRPLRDQMLQAHVYPIFVVWETGWQADLAHELDTWIAHRSGEGLDPETATLVAASESRGRAIWDLIVKRSTQACDAPTGGARLLAKWIGHKRDQRISDLSVVSHGAGDLLAANLATRLPGPVSRAVSIEGATPMHQFYATYGEMLTCGCLHHLTVLRDSAPADAVRPCETGDASVLDLVSQVWALDAATMRQSGRTALKSKTWDSAAVPLVGLTADTASFNVSEIDVFTRDGLFNPALVERLVDELTTPRGPGDSPRRMSVPSRDPLIRAEAERLRG